MSFLEGKVILVNTISSQNIDYIIMKSISNGKYDSLVRIWTTHEVNIYFISSHNLRFYFSLYFVQFVPFACFSHGKFGSLPPEKGSCNSCAYKPTEINS